MQLPEMPPTDKNDPELTCDPINRGKATRRCYVVAVDALNQEGFPSAPVWFRRDWRTLYAPFVGHWRQ